jgi:hypothetical protein
MKALTLFLLFLTITMVICAPAKPGPKPPVLHDPLDGLDELEDAINRYFQDLKTVDRELTVPEYTKTVHDYLGGAYITKYFQKEGDESGRIFVWAEPGYDPGTVIRLRTEFVQRVKRLELLKHLPAAARERMLSRWRIPEMVRFEEHDLSEFRTLANERKDFPKKGYIFNLYRSLAHLRVAGESLAKRINAYYVRKDGTAVLDVKALAAFAKKFMETGEV